MFHISMCMPQVLDDDDDEKEVCPCGSNMLLVISVGKVETKEG